ncbi:MAG: amidohydrolase family protein, partial [Candidatus Thermoplasmatota archaeon]
REGGVEGLEPLKKAVDMVEEDIRPVVMGRPARREHDERELEEILSTAHGIGLSAYRDWDEPRIKKIADTAHKMGKPLAMHCSEDVREPIEEIIDLGVHHLVHMVEAAEEDLELCAEEDIPVVICPRSNMFFGKIPDIPKMLRCGVDLSLGTDNAMISNSDMFREMETAYRLGRLQGDVSPIDILMMATWNPRKSLKRPFIEDDEDDEKTLLILEHKKGDPAYNIIKDYSSREIIDVVKW